MEKSSHVDKNVLLLDGFDEDSQMLAESMRASGFDGCILTLSDTGFLPEGIESIYTVFCGKKEGGKPRYFNQIDVPDYWEIKSSNTVGQIFDRNHERGKIFYTKPTHKRLVHIVDWYDEEHIVRCSDHYNRYGFMYARTVFNHKGQLVSRSYFDAEGKEKVSENYVTHTILVNEGKKLHIFKGKVDFIKYVFDAMGIEPNRIFYNSLSTPFFVSEALPDQGKGDVLFWQEDVRPDIPGNMQIILNGQSTRTKTIYVQKKASYEKLIELGASSEVVKPLGFVYSFKKENQHSNRLLICTNSDQIEKLPEMVMALPNMEFHICALTEMSSKLNAFESYANVHLYPGAKESEIEALFMRCDYYLDINYQDEIVDATKQAFLHNCLILGFNETIHNRKYVLDEMIVDAKNYSLLVEKIMDASHLDLYIKKQKALAMAQNVVDYKNI